MEETQRTIFSTREHKLKELLSAFPPLPLRLCGELFSFT